MNYILIKSNQESIPLKIGSSVRINDFLKMFFESGSNLILERMWNFLLQFLIRNELRFDLNFKISFFLIYVEVNYDLFALGLN
jgi:hypothetical protein